MRTPLRILLMSLTLTLAACGGGGGGGDTGGNTGGDTGGNTGGDTGGNTGGDTGGDTGTVSLTITSNTNAVQVNELESTSFSFSTTYTGEKNITYTASHDELLNSEFKDNTVTISAAELTTVQAPVNYTVTVSDGELDSTFSVQVALNNTSFYEKQGELLTTLNAVDTQLDSHLEIPNIARFYADLNYRLNLISKSDSESVLNSALVLNEESTTSFKTKLQGMITALELLDKPGTNESELATVEDQYTTAQSVYQQNAFTSITDLANQTSEYMPVLPSSPLTLLGDKVSFFIGNFNYGEYDELTGSWVFNDEYAFLTKITNQTQQCTTTNNEGL